MLLWIVGNKHTDTHLTAFVQDNLGKLAGTRKVKLC